MTLRGAHGAYAEWAVWLDAFARGEDLPAEHLGVVDERLGPTAVARLLDRLEAAFRARTDLWADLMGRHLAQTTGGPEQLAVALVATRSRLRPLYALAADRRLPERVRTSLADALRHMLVDAQESLERSVARQPAHRERLLAVVRDHRLTVTPTPPRPVPSPAGPPPTGRRVIL